MGLDKFVIPEPAPVLNLKARARPEPDPALDYTNTARDDLQLRTCNFIKSYNAFCLICPQIIYSSESKPYLNFYFFI